jgi:hypothetical protein
MNYDFILQFFASGHLPEHLRVISLKFEMLAVELTQADLDPRELTVALRKLLESKDAAVRAALGRENADTP